jgi:hypothetical protein
MGILERLAGFMIGLLTVLILAIAGVFMFLPDFGRYLRVKSM